MEVTTKKKKELNEIKITVQHYDAKNNLGMFIVLCMQNILGQYLDKCDNEINLDKFPTSN